MKRKIRKNQVIIAALAVMIAAAGYLNYSGRIFGGKDDAAQTANELANQELLDISDEELDEAIEALIKPEEFHRYGLTVLVPDDFIVYEEAYDPDYTWDC